MIKLNSNISISYSEGYSLIHYFSEHKTTGELYHSSTKTYALVETALKKIREEGVECSEEDYILAKSYASRESARKARIGKERLGGRKVGEKAS